jgi:hypothetical protein
MLGVYVCKALGLSGASILVGAIAGVVAAMLLWEFTRNRRAQASQNAEGVTGQDVTHRPADQKQVGGECK